jgi:hypothetical protein
MSFVSLAIGDPVPPEGEFEIVHGGKSYAVVRHPRMHDGWLAMTPPATWRESGMKRYAKRTSAVRHVLKAIDALALSSHHSAPQGE